MINVYVVMYVCMCVYVCVRIDLSIERGCHVYLLSYT